MSGPESRDGAGIDPIETAPSEQARRIPVPGHNEAFYGPVPTSEQIFEIEFLEIAPSPIPVNKYFFVLLRGRIPPSTSTSKPLHITPSQLSNATIFITLPAILDKSGETLEPQTYTIPLRTSELAEGAHLAIRNSTGAYVEYLTVGEDRNDILTDYWIPGPFVQPGLWTFEVVASLGKEDDDNTGKGVCLFALTLTQRLEGDGGW